MKVLTLLFRQNKGDHGIGEKWEIGELVTTEEQYMDLTEYHGLYLDRIKLIPGLYTTSLIESRKQELMAQAYKSSFVCIDCDLYEFAIPVFKFIKNICRK